MTHKDTGHYSGKRQGAQLNEAIASRIKEKISDNRISCAEAHGIATSLNVTPAEVGTTIDLLEVRIIKCQLGLFGYSPERRIVKPIETVSEELERAIRESLTNGRIPCRSLWDIAKRFKIKRMDASSACETLKVKIKPCQLGAF